MQTEQRNGLYHATLTDTICGIKREIIVLLNDDLPTLFFDTELALDPDVPRRVNRRINPATLKIKGRVSQSEMDEMLPF